MDVEGRVALVTGGQRGLGAAMVESLLAHGAAKVYATARTPRPVPDTRVVPVGLEVTDDASVRALAQRCDDVAVLVNNAGILGPYPPLLDADVDEIAEVFDVDVFGSLRVARAFAPHLVAHRGAVVQMNSIFSWATGAVGYGASKAAGWSLANSLRHELADRSVSVLSVHVGVVDTEMVADLTVPKLAPAQVADDIVDALVAGLDELLVDDDTRRIKAALPGPLDGLVYP